MKLTEILHQIGDRVRLAARVTGLTGGTKVVESVVITNGGSGYTSTPTVGFSGGGGSGAAGTAVISGGQVIGVTMTNFGTGYTSAPAVGFTLGGGTGAAATAVVLGEKLDAIPTTSLSITYPLFVWVLLSGQINTYRLRSGTDAEVSPFIIRPDDYATTTNEKVWELIGPNIKNITRAQKTLTYAASVALDFDGAAVQDLSLTGNVTFTTSNRASGKSLMIRIACDATPRNFTLPAWRFLPVAAPASIAASKMALLKLTCWGANDTDVVAEYLVEP